MKFFHEKLGVTALPLVAALALAACGEPAKTTYEVEVVDKSGGELIVSEVDPEAVPVDLPETEMVAVPADEGASEAGGEAETE